METVQQTPDIPSSSTSDNQVRAVVSDAHQASVKPPIASPTTNTATPIPAYLRLVQIVIVVELTFGLAASALSALLSGLIAPIASLDSGSRLASKLISYGLLSAAWFVVLLLATPGLIVAVIKMFKRKWAYWYVVSFQIFALAPGLYSSITALPALSKGSSGASASVLGVLLQVLILVMLLVPSSRRFARPAETTAPHS